MIANSLKYKPTIIVFLAIAYLYKQDINRQTNADERTASTAIL